MILWKKWFFLVCQLRDACSRSKPFRWMIVCLAGMSIRYENNGITSIIRAMGLLPKYYNALLRLMKSSSLCIDKLTKIWLNVVIK